MMHWKPKGWTLIGTLLLAIPGAITGMRVADAMAQTASPGSIATTQVTDTVYRADGTPATGTVVVSWQAFGTAIGQSVPAGTASAAIGPGGALSIQLVPNAGSTPMGTYYTAVYHLDDGTVSREYWVVPASQTPVAVSSIKSTVLPTSVAMQTVSKSYVDTAIVTAITGHPLDGTSPYLLKTGDTMTGTLTLAGDPVGASDAADKHYVDTNVVALTTGLAQKTSLVPAGSQTVSQPVGTQLGVNNLNGVEYASQYVSGLGGNGIANALNSPDCVSGCDVKVDRSYSVLEGYYPAAWKSGTGGTHVEDARNGQRRDSYLNPRSSISNGEDAGQVIDVTSTRNTTTVGNSTQPNSFGLRVKQEALTGGSNIFPASIESVPYFKTNYDAISVAGTYNTMGQHALNSQAISCYGVGDCLIGSQYLTSSGGVRDEADEGAHPFDLEIMEDSLVFQGTCSTGCTTGSTSVTVAATSGIGTEGEGRYLIDKNPAGEISTGLLIGGTGQQGGGPGPGATFSGTNFPVSVFLATAAMIPSQTHNAAPGTVTVAIATSGVTTGFATSTASVSNQSGVACVADPVYSTAPHNYEMANYTILDATHLQMTLNKPHRAGATIAFGGLCGYGLEQTADTAGNIRQVFPVIGSYSASGLYYGGSITSIVGVQGNTSAFLNVSLPIASIARSNGVVTVTTSGNLPVDLNGLTVTLAGVADQSYNGSFVVTTTGSNTLTYPNTGANSTSTGGTVSKLTGGYVLYPMAEVLGVFNTATQSVDGQLTLAPNTVAWAANDPVEEPHYYQQLVAGDVTFVGQTTPRPTISHTAGIQYQSNVGPGMTGWSVINAAPATNYLGNGGTHSVPYAAYSESGIWQYTMDMHAGEQAVFRVRCNSHGCGKWNSGYDLFELDGQAGQDRILYQPTTNTLGFTVGGASYQFNGQAFTASTINAGTVNATTINGTVSAAKLPLFGGSGSGHAPGAVPDPGATAGTTRYLREDGSWTVPTGTGGQQPGALSNGSQPVAGALADYDFLQGSGSALTDISGSGNNATLGTGAAAPAWTSTGLSFTGQQQVSLPAALNGARTFFAAVYLNPLTTGSLPSNQYPVLVSSSMGAPGLNLMYAQEQNNTIVSGANSYAPTIWNGNVKTGVENVMSGFHVLAYVLGTGGGNVDHIYIDGVEAAAYDRQGSSSGLQTSGNLFLGSSNVSPFTTSGLIGTLYRFVAMPVNTLGAQQIAAISGSIRAEIANRGVAVVPAPVTQTTPTIYAIGDSITCGYSSVGGCPLTPWPSLLSLTNQPAYTVVNYGIPSVFIKAILGSEPNRVAPRCSSTAGPVNAIVFAGTNDLSFGGSGTTPLSVMGSLAGEVQVLKGAGCRVFLGTMISRLGNGVSGTTMDAAKDAYDALILATSKSVGADGVIDFAANPLLGADGAYASSAFQSDQTHPTQTGQQLMANAASNALNYYYGYNEVNPHSVTSLPYSMTAGDGAISLSGLTGAGTLTLPDCTGQSGATYRINNPQNTFAVSVAALNGSQLINGLSTAVVPANGTLTLRDVPNAKTVSGCHWEM